AQQKLEGRQVITLLKADQYRGEESFDQVGEWQPWRFNRRGQVICEVAAARFTLRRQDQASPEVSVEVALIRDWRKLLPVEEAKETVETGDWQADLIDHQRHFREEGWHALPAPAALTTAKLIPVITTGQGMEAGELAHTVNARVLLRPDTFDPPF